MVAIVDADHFKRVNDTLSHEVGDRVIRELSLVLQEYLMAWPDPSRSGSRLVARLGGEEFLVILPGLDLAAAGTLLTGMRNQVALHEWDPLVGKLSLTVSVGATSAEPGDTQAILLGRADRNLYLAKAGGRNRVVVAPSAVRRSSAVQNGRSSAEGSIQARPLSRTMPALKIEADPRTSRASKLGRRPGRTVGESVIPER